MLQGCTANEQKPRYNSNFPHSSGRVAVGSAGGSVHSLLWLVNQAVSSLVMGSAVNTCAVCIRPILLQP